LAMQCYFEVMIKKDEVSRVNFFADIDKRGLVTADLSLQVISDALWQCLDSKNSQCSCLQGLKIAGDIAEKFIIAEEYKQTLGYLQRLTETACLVHRVETVNDKDLKQLEKLIAEVDIGQLVPGNKFFAALDALINYKHGNLQLAKRIIRANDLDLTQMMVIFSSEESVALIKLAYWY